MMKLMMESGCDPDSFFADFGEQMKARQKPQGIIRSNRELTFEHNCFERSLPLLERALTPLLNSRENESYPAVDLAAGSCVYTVAWAQHFRQPRFKSSLEWYPTDYSGRSEFSERPPERCGGPIENDLRKTLRFLANNSDPLFADTNGMAVYPGDSIRLEGLKSQQYNGLHGVVVGPDPQVDGRYEVQLGNDMKWKSCSFKSSNMKRASEWMGSDKGTKFEEASEYTEDRKRLLYGMLGRSCEVDILSDSTWNNLADIHGKCALVTCTNLLCCLGYRNPDAWKDCLRIASRLLRSGGFYMAEDDVVGDFGDAERMEEFVQSNQLRLKISMATITEDGESVKMVWEKI